MKFTKIASLLFISVFLLVHACCADTIYFKDGRVLEGKIVEQTDKYVKIEFGDIGLSAKHPRKNIDRIEFDQDIVQQSANKTNNSDIISAIGQGTKEQTSITPQQLWGLATSAMLFERNHDSHELLGGRKPTEESIRDWKNSLMEWWGVKNRFDLLAELSWLETEGHRRDFDKMVAIVESMSELELDYWLSVQDDREDDFLFALVKKYHKQLGSKSILGWDYSRYVALCRWGYLVGYLSEEEAWEKIMPKAKELQKIFDSWQELGENYLIGRRFWSSSYSHQPFQLAYEQLLNNPASPWKILPWEMDLDSKTEDNSDNAGMCVMFAKSYQDKGMLDEALKQYEKALEIDSANASAYLGIANLYRQRQLYEKAEDAFDKAIMYSKDQPSAYLSLAEYYESRKMDDKARELLEKMNKLFPSYGVAYNRLALIYVREKRCDEAIALLKKAIELEPENSSYYVNLGYAYENNKQFDEVLEICKKAIEIDDRDESAYYNMGDAYLEKGMREEAVDMYRKVINLNPDRARKIEQKFCRRGTECYKKGMFEDAIWEWEVSAFFYQECSFSQYHLACCYSRLNDAKKALYYLDNALILDSSRIKDEVAKESNNHTFDAIKDSDEFKKLMNKY